MDKTAFFDLNIYPLGVEIAVFIKMHEDAITKTFLVPTAENLRVILYS